MRRPFATGREETVVAIARWKGVADDRFIFKLMGLHCIESNKSRLPRLSESVPTSEKPKGRSC